MKKITSVNNNEIKAITKLSTAKGRNDQKKFIAEGHRIIKALLTSKLNLINLYITENYLDLAKSITFESKIIIISEIVLNKISTTKTPSGMLAVFEVPQPPNIKKLEAGIVLADISDPGNMGTLIRTAAACNIKSIVIIEGTDPWSPKVVQASAGTIGNVHIFELSWENLIQNKKDLQLCALVVQNGVDLNKINKNKALLIVGNEAHGIKEEWQNQSDMLVTLKMPGNTESLNAAVAGSIALYNLFCNK